MDAVSLLAHLMFKTFFLALPVGVAWLAFRRLSMSQSQNAWLYSAVGLVSSIAAIALAPWALGFAAPAWQALVMALLCPPIWMATVFFCDIRDRAYGDEGAAEWMADKFQSTRRSVAQNVPQSPLILKEPIFPDVSDTMFRTTRPAPKAVFKAERSEPVKPVAPLVREPRVSLANAAPEPKPVASLEDIQLPDEPRNVLDVARDMRGDRARAQDAARDMSFAPETA